MDKEIFKSIPGFPGYEVSDQGDVRSFWRRTRIKGLGKTQGTKCVLDSQPQRILKPFFYLGYPSVTLRKTGKSFTRNIHTLILETFVGPRPPGGHSRHRDGIRANSCLTNLVWGTPEENAADTKLHGNSLVGESNHRAKLTDTQIIQIRELHGHLSQRKLAKMFGVCQATIWYVLNRLHWTHLP